MAADLLGEDVGDGERGGVELQRVVEDFQPAHCLRHIAVLPVLELPYQRLRALPAVLQSFAPLRLLLQ